MYDKPYHGGISVIGEKPNEAILPAGRHERIPVRPDPTPPTPSNEPIISVRDRTTLPWREMAPHPELERLLKEGAERVKNMKPDDYEAMLKAQRESWARQDMD